jgi:hypothetical protein
VPSDGAYNKTMTKSRYDDLWFKALHVVFAAGLAGWALVIGGWVSGSEPVLFGGFALVLIKFLGVAALLLLDGAFAAAHLASQFFRRTRAR